MFCTTCGKEVADNLNFCTGCGKSLSNPQGVNQTGGGNVSLPPSTPVASLPVSDTKRMNIEYDDDTFAPKKKSQSAILLIVLCVLGVAAIATTVVIIVSRTGDKNGNNAALVLKTFEETYLAGRSDFNTPVSKKYRYDFVRNADNKIIGLKAIALSDIRGAFTEGCFIQTVYQGRSFQRCVGRNKTGSGDAFVKGFVKSSNKGGLIEGITRGITGGIGQVLTEWIVSESAIEDEAKGLFPSLFHNRGESVWCENLDKTDIGGRQPQTTGATTTKYVNSPNTGFLNLRAGPSTDFDILTPIPQGAAVSVFNNTLSGDWVKVRYESKDGFVNQRFLSNTRPAAASAGNRDSRLVGKWKWGSDFCFAEDIDFRADGTFSYTENCLADDCNDAVITGTWNTQGNNLTMVYGNGRRMTDTYTIRGNNLGIGEFCGLSR